jgi:glycosyltransferase involved in cell wall biosynthesis
MVEPNTLAVFISFSGTGGVERMVLNLLPEFVKAGIQVDLLAILKHPIPELQSLEDTGVRLVELNVKHSTAAAPALIRYLRRHRPAALLAAKDRAIRTAVIARKLSGVHPRLVGRLGTHLSTALQRRSPLARWLRTWPMRLIYPGVDGIIANSEGVAEDTLRLTGLAPNRVTVVRNPVVTPALARLAGAEITHPWFLPDAVPIILGAGRLTPQKDFPTLVRAFALVRRQRPCRLVILGEGKQRAELEGLAGKLGLAGEVCLTGHVTNPYPFMAIAKVFVLSSAWEGSPNVLTEALALGTPVVATDCPSGPREILRGGDYGPLVPVGDVPALANAILATLEHPLPAALLRQAVSEYSSPVSAQRYLEVLGFS